MAEAKETLVSSSERSVNIDDYIKLYNEGVSLNKIKPLSNQTYKLFKQSGEDIRIVHRSQTYANAAAFSKINHFMLSNDYFYMIPVTTVKGTIVGFIVRGVLRKDYGTVSRTFSSYEKQVPLMYGFNKKFQEYEKEVEKRGKCLPIIVCEGSKDCLMLKQFYPYVLANNTSSMGVNAQVLRNISNKFLLAYDNDESGQEGIKRDKRTLRNLGAYVESLQLHDGFKDCADYLDYPDEFLELKDQVKRKIRKLYNI
jgi:DNA primase